MSFASLVEWAMPHLIIAPILLPMATAAPLKAGKYVGICGQGPSDHPDFAAWLVEQGIDSVSLNPDTVVDTWLYLAEQHKAG